MNITIWVSVVTTLIALGSFVAALSTTRSKNNLDQQGQVINGALGLAEQRGDELDRQGKEIERLKDELGRKDKEILNLRQQLSIKDDEILRLRFEVVELQRQQEAAVEREKARDSQIQSLVARLDILAPPTP